MNKKNLKNKIFETNNVQIYEENGNLVFDCIPLKSTKYISKFLVYLVMLIGALIFIFNFRDIFYFFSPQHSNLGLFFGLLTIFIGTMSLMIAYFLILNFFKVFKYSLVYNFYLCESLIINKDNIQYQNNFGKYINIKISNLEFCDFYSNKSSGDHDVTYLFSPSYINSLCLKEYNQNKLSKILYSINYNDLTKVNCILFKQFAKIGSIFNESILSDYKKTKRRGYRLKFITAFEYYFSNSDDFSFDERQILNEINKYIEKFKTMVSDKLIKGTNIKINEIELKCIKRNK